MLEQIADDVDEIILVDGNSTDATLITARSYRPDIRVMPQEGIGKGSALLHRIRCALDQRHHRDDGRGRKHGAPGDVALHPLPGQRLRFRQGLKRFVVGGGSLVDITRFRRLGNRFLLAVFNSLYDAELTDLCYGFCAFHRRYL